MSHNASTLPTSAACRVPERVVTQLFAQDSGLNFVEAEFDDHHGG